MRHDDTCCEFFAACSWYLHVLKVSISMLASRFWGIYARFRGIYMYAYFRGIYASSGEYTIDRPRRCFDPPTQQGTVIIRMVLIN